MFLLDNIECPPIIDTEDIVPDVFLNLILSYNLQFLTLCDNLVIQALTEKDTAKIFTEKLLLLFNRGSNASRDISFVISLVEYFLEDPVRTFDCEPTPPHSLLKMFTDLFGSLKTANLFYTNDVRVLIDMVIRNILDLSAVDVVMSNIKIFILFK